MMMRSQRCSSVLLLFLVLVLLSSMLPTTPVAAAPEAPAAPEAMKATRTAPEARALPPADFVPGPLRQATTAPHADGSPAAPLLQTTEELTETLLVISDASLAHSGTYLQETDYWKWVNTDGRISDQLAPAKWVDPFLNSSITVTRTFTLPRDIPVTGVLEITADNTYSVSLNGIFVGTDSDWGTIENYAVTLQPGDNVLVVDATDTGEKSGIIFRLTASLPPLDDQSINPPDRDNPSEQCPKCDDSVGGPINTRFGNLWLSETDLTVGLPGPRLQWGRTYDSRKTDATFTETITLVDSPMGVGWQHHYATHLLTDTAAPAIVTVVSPKGNRWRFTDNGDGTFTPAPGIYSTLERDGTTYIHTRRDLTAYHFDAATGRLTAIADPQGRRLLLSYDGNGRLTTIADEALPTQRALTLAYDHPTDTTLITSVSDGTRSVSYSYDSNGDLTGSTDVLGQPTTYHYDTHLLTGVQNALGQWVERTEYETPYTAASRAISQTLLDGRHLAFAYPADITVAGTTTITTTGADGTQEVSEHAYDARNTLVSETYNGVAVGSAGYDGNLAPDSRTDANGNPTSTTSNALGQPEAITNAQGETTQVEYDDHDRPIVITDTTGLRTEMAYDTNNNLIRQTSSITTANPLGFTTVSTYNVRYGGKNWLEEQESPAGVVTRYEYNSLGQMTSRTVGYGTTGAQTTSYEYDALGRVTAAIVGEGTAFERRDVTEYNADHTIARTIQHYVDGTFDSARPEEDIITRYGYDALGRQVWTQDVAGRYAVTHYNSNGQVDWTARTYVDGAFNPGDATTIPATPPNYDRTAPDQNVVTEYAYDGLGRTTLVTQHGILDGAFDPATEQFASTITRVTRTEYDDAYSFGSETYQAVITTLNDQPGVSAGPDVNVQTLMLSDYAGNLIWQQDALGRWTKMEYDTLNRPIKTIVNYENGDPTTIDAGNTGWATLADTDIIQVTVYAPGGRIDHTIDAYVDGTFNANTPDEDRITRYGYDDLGRVTHTIWNEEDGDSNTGGTDTDSRSETAYDPQGRVIGSKNPLGQWTSQDYDALGRVFQTTQNCTDSNGDPVPPHTCAAFNPNEPDRNLTSRTTFDELGRAFESTQNYENGTFDQATPDQDITTRRQYDLLGRATATTQNYVDGAFTDTRPDEDITSSQTYDALGRVATRTDAAGSVVEYAYNDLGQLVEQRQVLGAGYRTTRMGYDGAGNRAIPVSIARCSRPTRSTRWSATPHRPARIAPPTCPLTCPMPRPRSAIKSPRCRRSNRTSPSIACAPCAARTASSACAPACPTSTSRPAGWGACSR